MRDRTSRRAASLTLATMVLATMALASAPGSGAAQEPDYCSDPSRACSQTVPPACFERFGAGAAQFEGELPAALLDGLDCSEHRRRFQECLGVVIEQCQPEILGSDDDAADREALRLALLRRCEDLHQALLINRPEAANLRDIQSFPSFNERDIIRHFGVDNFSYLDQTIREITRDAEMAFWRATANREIAATMNEDVERAEQQLLSRLDPNAYDDRVQIRILEFKKRERERKRRFAEQQQAQTDGALRAMAVRTEAYCEHVKTM